MDSEESVESGDEPSQSEEEARRSQPRSATKRKRALSESSAESLRTREGAESGAESSSSKARLRRRVRLQGQYRDKYRQLLNSMTLEATEAPHMSYEPAENLETSQIGLSIWTNEQKDAFFHAIARYGRDNLLRLASAAEKSEQEVTEYLQLLKEGLFQYIIMNPAGIPSKINALEAAVELSDECRLALEASAEALAWYQTSWENKQEQKEHGDIWLLDREVADELDELYLEDDDSESHPSAEPAEEPEKVPSESHETKAHESAGDSHLFGSVPAAKLLNLSRFIDLSERIFMNSLDPERNFRTFRDPDPIRVNKNKLEKVEKGPSIFHSAFHDFHRVIVSLTRRLIHVSLSQATARLRATDSLTRKRQHQPSIQRRDVVSALHIVGMKESSIDFWANLPTRHKFNWFFDKRGGNFAKKIPATAAEAKEFLSQPLKRVRPPDEAAELEAETGEAAGSGQRIYDDTTGEAIEEVEDLSDSSSADQGSIADEEAIESSESETDDIAAQGDTNDNYLDALDTANSRAKEKMLWELMQQDVPSTLDLSPPKIPEKPKPLLLVEFDGPQDQWRDWTDPQAEWERAVDNEGEESEEDIDVGDDRESSGWGEESETDSGTTPSIDEEAEDMRF